MNKFNLNSFRAIVSIIIVLVFGVTLSYATSTIGTTISSDSLTAGSDGTDGEITIFSEETAGDGTDNFVKFQPNPTMTQDTTYILPADDGTASQVLETDGSGNLDWVTGATGNTLDTAYDQGGAGAGGVINVDTSAVTLTGTADDETLNISHSDDDKDAVEIFASNTAYSPTNGMLTLKSNEENTGSFNFLQLITDMDGTPSTEFYINQSGTIGTSGQLIVGGNVLFDTNTLAVNATSNEVGIGVVPTGNTAGLEIETADAANLRGLLIDNNEVTNDTEGIQIDMAEGGGAPLLISPLSASPNTTDEGSIYYDSDDDNLYVYANGGWADLTGGIADVVDDITPQLGGQLDVNGNAIGDGTLELLKFSETGSAVNEISIANAATGAGPEVFATGDDANIDISIDAKGTGTMVLQSSGTGGVAIGTSTTSSQVTIAQTDAANAPALTLDSEESSSGQRILSVLSDNPADESENFYVNSGGTAGASSVLQAGVDGSDGELRLYSEQGGIDYILTLQPSASMTGDTTYSLPVNYGAAGQVLTDSAGNGLLSWSSVISSTLVDNTTDALDIQQGANNYININTTNGAENISFGNDAINPTFSFLGSGVFHTWGPITIDNAATFNDNSDDVDFRIESNNEINALFVDGGNDSVGIGTSTPTARLHVYQSAPAPNQALFKIGTSDDSNRFSVDEDGDATLDSSLSIGSNMSLVDGVITQVTGSSLDIHLGGNAGDDFVITDGTAIMTVESDMDMVTINGDLRLDPRPVASRPCLATDYGEVFFHTGMDDLCACTSLGWMVVGSVGSGPPVPCAP